MAGHGARGTTAQATADPAGPGRPDEVIPAPDADPVYPPALIALFDDYPDDLAAVTTPEPAAVDVDHASSL